MDASATVLADAAATATAAAAARPPAHRIWVSQTPSLALLISNQDAYVSSNNPFAAFGGGPSNPSSQFLSPSPQPPPQSTSPVSFNLQGTYANSSGPSLSTSNLPPTSSFSPPPPSQSAPPTQRGATKTDQEHAHLASLFANRDDGIDSFGNFGQLRSVCSMILATSCTFLTPLSRYGQQAGRFIGQTTGNTNTHNPFAHQQQQQQGGADQPFFSI